MNDFTNGAHECLCDGMYKDANKLASCGDCPRDYVAGAWDARRKYLEEHSKMTDRYEEWRNFYAEKVRSWMSLEELRAECGKLQTVDAPSVEVLLVHAMHALEERERRDEALLRQGPHPAITHCDGCGCDWLDNGLNPIGCPYCAAQPDTGGALRPGGGTQLHGWGPNASCPHLPPNINEGSEP